MQETDRTLSLTPPSEMSKLQRIGSFITAIGILSIIIGLFTRAVSPLLSIIFGLVVFAVAITILLRARMSKRRLVITLLGIFFLTVLLLFVDLLIPKLVMLVAIFGLTSLGAVIYFFGKYDGIPGIRNNGIAHSEATKKNGYIAWILAIVFTGFYIILYWYPQHLHGLIVITEPLSKLFTGNSTVFYKEDGSISHYNQWFLYGFIYTVAVLVMGVRFYLKYRNIRYQVVRTISVSFFQLVLAFMLPIFLESMNSQNPEVFVHYFSYFWPLDYDALFPGTIPTGTTFGKFVIGWSLITAFIAVPVLTYYFGKRWYCSWVCGCGGLAETAGDPFRQLSNKSLKAWKVERILIHGVLVLITLLTIGLIVNSKWQIIEGGILEELKKWYAFIIASTFAGVIGTGFYPIFGSRVWCRFGCPQAAILGILQKYFSRFRITTNGGQCISCGNCSTYCEMGIDVKWYAQREQNIVRASCVGCGICSAVCPRGVLKLENGPVSGRTKIQISREEVKILEV